MRFSPTRIWPLVLTSWKTEWISTLGHIIPLYPEQIRQAMASSHNVHGVLGFLISLISTRWKVERGGELWLIQELDSNFKSLQWWDSIHSMTGVIRQCSCFRCAWRSRGWYCDGKARWWCTVLRCEEIDAISKKKFRPGGMALSEWTHSVIAVRDTPVADYSTRGLNTMCRVAYRPLIAVSPFLFALSVLYFKRTLWRCGHLWPYVGNGSFGTRLHRDCNAMGDATKISPQVPSTCAQNTILSLLIIRDCNVMGDAAKISPCVPFTCAQNAILSVLIIRDCKAMGDTAKIFPRVPSTCAQKAILSFLIVHIIPSRQIYVAIDNPSLVPSVSWLTTSSYLWNYVCAADDVSYAENLQSNGCRYFSHLYKFWGRDPSYTSFPVLWWAPGLTSTQRKLHPRFGPWFWIVVAVATGDAHSACHNTSPCVALPTPSHSVDPLRASSGFLCIDISEICVHHLNPQLEP